ncbi:MAG: hypothetical protein HXY41_17960 [Chloroflexi bacterium]|nr:hypothetical protein [Chloroflexota bacterium]
MSWLESLARQQGAKKEEMTTEANLTIPPPEHIGQIEGPGYTPYSFDTLGLSERPSEENVPVEAVSKPESRLEPADLEDPSAWLDSLAASQGFAPETVSRPKAGRPAGGDDDIDEIQAALNRGEQVPPDQMERWMSRQLEFGAAREEPVEAYDPDAPAIPAELPDWLIEQVGAAPPEELVTPAPALIDSITEPPQAADIPDWLKEEPSPENDLDGIFATTTDEVPQQTAAPQFDDEATDPWAEALEYESQHDISDVPDWYTRNVNDPERIATVNRRLFGEAEQEALQEAALEPEAELPAGQPTDVPDWLRETMDEAAELEEAEAVEAMPDWLAQEMDVAPAVPTPVDEIPDWLRAVDADEVPDWLKESLSPAAQAPAPVVPEVQPPAPPPAPVPVAMPTPAPAPTALPAQPVPAASIDSAGILQNARASSHDLDTRLKHYEALVRANVELDAVTGDLTRLADQHKSNAAIYRVLGDGLMRQGKLQAALDTYRKALNQL